MTTAHLSGILVEGGPRLGVLLHNGGEGGEIFEKILVGEMAGVEGLECSSEIGEGGGGNERFGICVEEVDERGEEDSSGLLFRRDTQKRDVERNEVVITGDC